MSFHLYAFVPLEFCRETMRAFSLTAPVLQAISIKKEGPWFHRDFISVRKGDLLFLLQEVEDDPTFEQRINDKLALSPYPVYVYDQLVVNRGSAQVIDAMADLFFLSNHATIRGYCPYSWFSSWIYLLSPVFSPKNPVFDVRVHDVMLV